jgi:hypothetical protein
MNQSSSGPNLKYLLRVSWLSFLSSKGNSSGTPGHRNNKVKQLLEFEKGISISACRIM